ncbi:MAG: hypothetical protein Q9184_004979 [Pyrenodesmia sp. 2 TL-2023]
MLPLTTLFLLLLLLLTTLLSASANNTTTLNFDSLPTHPSGLSSLPSPYHHLTFTSFSVFSPHSPSFRNILTPSDRNCATSPPNALLGSRQGGRAASFFIADDDDAADGARMYKTRLRPWFALRGFWVKPLNWPPEGDVTISVRGYKSSRYHHHHHRNHEKEGKEEEEGEGDKGILNWHVDFPAGYHEPFFVDLRKYGRGTVWDGLRGVEVEARFGVQGLDWEFCLDGLEVGFEEVGKEGQGQVVLGRG